jgi:hypothetical protein
MLLSSLISILLIVQVYFTNGIIANYDKVGNRKTVTDGGNTVKYNFANGIYQPDPLNRLNSVERNFDGASYRTAYQYDKALLTGIRYPEATGWLTYNYNTMKQLSEVVGFTAPNGITLSVAKNPSGLILLW